MLFRGAAARSASSYEGLKRGPGPTGSPVSWGSASSYEGLKQATTEAEVPGALGFSKFL